VIVTAEVRVPVAVGLNMILIVQWAPAPTLDPQLLTCAKSPVFPPETPMLEMVMAAVPELVSVMVFAALAVPTLWLAYVRLVGDRVAVAVVGAVPVPDKVAD